MKLELKNPEKYKKQAWQAGVDWFNRANAQWDAVIGSTPIKNVSSTTSTTIKCLCPHENNLNNGLIVTDPNDCRALGCKAITNINTIYTYTTTILDSDGVVLAESAKNLPGATHAPVRVEGKLVNGAYTGSSHMQIRNDEGLQKHLNILLSGGYGRFFYTPKQIL